MIGAAIRGTAPGNVGTPVITPGSYPTGLTLWAKADAIVGATNGAALPSGWGDSSAAGNTLNAASAPTYIAGGAKGGTMPVVRFNGSNSMESNAPCGGPEQTVVGVCKITSKADTHSFRGVSAAGGLMTRFAADGKPELIKDSIIAIGTASASIGFTDFHVVFWTYSDSTNTYTFEIDGVSAGGGTTTDSLVAAATRLGRHTGSGHGYLGDIAELASWNVLLAPADRAAIAAGLMSKWL